MSLASLLTKGSLRGFATATPATFATNSHYIPPTVATLATAAVAKAPDRATNDLTPDTDRHCWPHSTAMTGREIDVFTARLSRFADRGLSLDDGEALTDKLVIRDREADDRRVCLECRNLSGYSPGSWRCSNWKPASVGTSGLPLDLVLMLQRCYGFENLNL
jgi:hypothetical protein